MILSDFDRFSLILFAFDGFAPVSVLHEKTRGSLGPVSVLHEKTRGSPRPVNVLHEKTRGSLRPVCHLNSPLRCRNENVPSGMGLL